MTEYSYSDLVKMQDQAIKRVKEMQERARLTIKENPIPELGEPLSKNDKNENRSELTEKRENEKPPQKKKEEHRHQNKKIDSDVAVLLPLIMLLSHENADSLLMIALLYILA